MRALLPALVLVPLLVAQTPPTPAPDPGEPAAPEESAPEEEASSRARTALNLLGQTDTKSGEARRNENVQFNLIDNNALKEINIRLGVSATSVTEFEPARNYFAAEFGTPPSTPLALQARPAVSRAWHGAAQWSHLNSVLSARSFFQVGSVLPARDNNVSVEGGGGVWRGAVFGFDASRQRTRGVVNGNILIPRVEERTALATDPVVREFVTAVLNVYPLVAPNRTDIDPRMLNTNSPQSIDNDSASGRLTQRLGERDQLVASYAFLTQRVLAFQLFKGQNPDTTTKNHRSSLAWVRSWNPRTETTAVYGYERIRSLIVAEKNNLGPQIFISSALTPINPNNPLPIDRVQNLFRTGGQVRHTQGRHVFTAGAEILRRQLNGRESDAHPGAMTFFNTAAYDAIGNLRRGLIANYFRSIGETTRGFRNFDQWWYAGDRYSLGRLTLSAGVGYRPISRPREVNGLNQLPYFSDNNNLGPHVGLAWRAPVGVWRAAYGLHYGEIFPVTFQQIRFNYPGNWKSVTQNPSLRDILDGRVPARPADGVVRPVLYAYEKNLVSPYAQQYHFTWEFEPVRQWTASLAYIGSRGVKLLHHWYQNRGAIVSDLSRMTLDTVDARRPDPRYNEVRLVSNGSRARFDAFKARLVVPRWRGAGLDASYWFSKAIDLGADYTNTAHDNDSFRNRSQGEFDAHGDLRGRSRFDQPHALLVRGSWELPRVPRKAGAWRLSGVAVQKTGTPFQINTGSDAPGFGNVDGMSGDRPNLVDPTILGRSIDHPDRARALLPRTAFAFIRTGEPRGNLGRHVFRRGPVKNLNGSLEGVFRLRKERTVTFRVEANNLTNSPQFAEPGASLTDPNFGVITNTLNDGRSFRAVLRLGF